MRRRGMDAITIGGFGPIADQNDFIYIHRCPSPQKNPLPSSPLCLYGKRDDLAV